MKIPEKRKKGIEELCEATMTENCPQIKMIRH